MLLITKNNKFRIFIFISIISILLNLFLFFYYHYVMRLEYYMAISNSVMGMGDMEKYIPSTTIDTYVFDRLLTKKLQSNDSNVRFDALSYLRRMMLYSNDVSRKLELCKMAWNGIDKDIPAWNKLVGESTIAEFCLAKEKKGVLEFRLNILTHFLWLDYETIDDIDVFLSPTSLEQMEDILQGCYITGLSENGPIASDALLIAILLSRGDTDKVNELIRDWRLNSPDERIAKWGDGALHIANKYIGLKTDCK